jgi:hypothetical protein
LVLVRSEGSRRQERHRSRAWFRVALLLEAVLALIAGFFGGAVVFGLDPYAWPPRATVGDLAQAYRLGEAAGWVG